MSSAIPKTMKAAVVYEPGGPNVFKVEDRPVPTPKDGDVLIKIMAAGMNRAEMFTRQGHSGPSVKFPRVIGIEAAGIVAACPDGTFKPGDKVFTCMEGLGRTIDGGYAQYTCIKAKNAIKIPDNSLPWDIIGALPEMVQTAYGAIHFGLKIKSGDKLLVRGGTTSVGLTAASLAKLEGCYVASTSRSDKSKSAIMESGADEFIIDNGKISETHAGKFTRVLELVGTTTILDSLKCTTRREDGGWGAVSQVGIVGNAWSLDGFKPMEDIPEDVVLGRYSGGGDNFHDIPWEKIIKALEKGDIKVKVGRKWKLDQVAEAHEVMENGKAGGKMVIMMDQE